MFNYQNLLIVAARSSLKSAIALLMAFFFTLAPHVRPADLVVYDNALAPGWENWSWDATVDFGAAAPAHSAPAAIGVTFTKAWAGLSLHTADNIEGSSYRALRFWIHGGGGGQKIKVVFYDGADQPAGAGVTLTLAAQWQQVELTTASLGAPASITALVWQEAAGAAAAPFTLDDVTLLAAPAPPPAPPPALSVDAQSGRHPIAPLIYGMNMTVDQGLAAELRLPVRRWGGNATTRYNWQNDTANHASDWFFENIPEPNGAPQNLPDGSAADRFIERDRATGTRTILTVPLIGWTPRSRTMTGGFSVKKYGAQQQVDPWHSEWGNGIKPGGAPVTGNDPADTSTAISPLFVKDWIAHLTARYGGAAAGGVAYYALDNEPMLWNSTHRDVHPQPVSYDEILSRTLAYAAAIKDADPAAATLGPALWGWTAYFYSALDAAEGGDFWNHPRDRNAHGGVAFVDWYLGQLRAYEQAHGRRILDYLDLHYYPQADGVSLTTAGAARTQALRLRSTRALWDPTYIDESWIKESVRLIPRMKDWVRDNYPGTALALTEYNWGGLEHINGALAQADLLGIFGREGLAMALLWDPPAASQPGAFAFRMYRNADGQGKGFGEESVRAASADQERLAIYAALRGADGALTIMVINKTGGDLATSVTLGGFRPLPAASVYRYSEANLSAIAHLSDLAAAAPVFPAAFPKNSITLVVLRPAPAATEKSAGKYF